MLCRKANNSLIYCDRATGARRLIGVRPVEHAVNGNCVENLDPMRGSRGLAPLGYLPLWGREGVTLTNSTECKPE
jgi:hypothetical protein